MKAYQMKTTESLVRSILEKNVATRSNDKLLICEVYRKLGLAVDKIPFATVINLEGIPSVETITRVRRKCQELDSDLRATETAENSRRDSQGEVLRYVFGKKY